MSGYLSEEHKQARPVAPSPRHHDENLQASLGPPSLVTPGLDKKVEPAVQAERAQLFRNMYDGPPGGGFFDPKKGQSGSEKFVHGLNNQQLLSLAEVPLIGNALMHGLENDMRRGGVTKSERAELERIEAATFTPGAGFHVHGVASDANQAKADEATFTHMVRREMLASGSFRQLMNKQNRDAKHPVTENVGRHLPGVFMDSFDSQSTGLGQQSFDLADAEQLPVSPSKGNRDAILQGEIMSHSIAEARQGAYGHDYEASHKKAIQAENRYRQDRGQKGKRPMPPNDGQGDAAGNFNIDLTNGHHETWGIDSNSDITSISRHD